MLDEDLSQRFGVIIKGAREPLVRRYLEEAANCFKIGVYNGAVIFAWNALSCYIREVIDVISFPLFEYNYRIIFGEYIPSDRQLIKDGKLLQACEGMGLLSNEMVVKLDRLRKCRNNCAHPSGTFVTAEETFDLIVDVSDFLSHQVKDERLNDIGILKKFIKDAREMDGEKIAPWIQEDLCQVFAHKLLDMYLKDEMVQNISAIEGLWHQIWMRLDGIQRESLWSRLVKAVDDVLNEKSLRTPDEMARFIVWPSSEEECIERDEIARLYVEWFNRRIMESDFRAIDLELAHWLRDHLPSAPREQLQVYLMEMTRRYVE